jgi:hypothetical protein
MPRAHKSRQQVREARQRAALIRHYGPQQSTPKASAEKPDRALGEPEGASDILAAGRSERLKIEALLIDFERRLDAGEMIHSDQFSPAFSRHAQGTQSIWMKVGHVPGLIFNDSEIIRKLTYQLYRQECDRVLAIIDAQEKHHRANPAPKEKYLKLPQPSAITGDCWADVEAREKYKKTLASIRRLRQRLRALKRDHISLADWRMDCDESKVIALDGARTIGAKLIAAVEVEPWAEHQRETLKESIKGNVAHAEKALEKLFAEVRNYRFPGRDVSLSAIRADSGES